MLSLILPTYNESENLPLLLPNIAEILQGLPFEVIVVDDDSPDRTWEKARELSQKFAWLRVIRRVGRRGLSSAVIEGFLASKGTVLAVMDADGQHDLSVLPKLYEAVKDKGGIALGSRYTAGGSIGEWDERRHAMSRLATRLAIRLCRVKVSDPMSGFFAVDRKTFEASLPQLNPKGFKILLDLLVHVPSDTPLTELPFTFGKRTHGESKLSRRVQIEFIEYLYDVTVGRYLPLTFIQYCLVGFAGIVINLLAYLLAQSFLPDSMWMVSSFSVPILIGIEAAIVFNFLLNNSWTFSRARLTGSSALTGFMKYNALCLFGAAANYSVTSSLMEHHSFSVTSALLLGAIVGVIWNYTMSLLFTWRA